MIASDCEAHRIAQRVSSALARDYPDLRAGEPLPAGHGLTFLVFRVESRLGPLAVRVPRRRWLPWFDGRPFDARRLLRQEAVLARHAAAIGIPTPAVRLLDFGRDVDFLASDFVQGDGTPPDWSEAGRLVATLHAALPPRWRGVELRGGSLAGMLARRTLARVAALEQHLGQCPLLDLQTLERCLARTPRRRALLHMDIRPDNLLTQRGSIAAVVDWENALRGDPALELARIDEFGYLNPAFIAGYESVLPLPSSPADVELVYRLDTAALLARIFLSSAPDALRARAQVERVRELQARLLRLLA